MAVSYLPSRENISIFGGELYFQPDGAARARSMGHVDAFSWTPSIEEDDVFAATSGQRQKIATIIKETSVSLSLTLKETTIANMAYAVQGIEKPLLQTAKPGATKEETDVVAGEMIELGALAVTNVTVTDGAAELENGVDYVLNAEAGVITALKPRAVFDVAFDIPAIAESDGRRVVEVLGSQDGISGVFSVIGKNTQGRRFKLSGVRATLKPSGDVAFLSDGSSVQSIELEGSGIANEALPLTPWGVLTALN